MTLFNPAVATAAEIAGQECPGPNQSTYGTGWIGPFVANPSGTKATDLGIDVMFDRGLYYANNSGGLDPKTVTWVVQARPVDDSGVALGDFFQVASETYTDSTNTAIRRSYRYAVAPGRYEVQSQRTNNNDQDSRTGHEMRWTSLRSYLDETPDYGPVTLLAVKMRATDNLSERSSRLVNGIVVRKLHVWDSDSPPSHATSTER